MIGILLKNRLRAVLGSAVSASRSGNIKKATTLKKALFVTLYLLIVLIFFAYSSALAYLFASALLPTASWLYYLLFMAISLTLIFVLGIFEAKTELFECKDNDLLLSMPIKPRDIVAARTLVILIYNYVINIVIMLPAIVMYAIFAKSFVGVLGGILIFILVPIFATALASVGGYLVAEITRKLKFKNLITVVLTLVFMTLYFIGMELFGNNIGSIIQSLAGLSVTIGEKYKILKFIGNAALLKPLPFLCVAAVSILAGAIAYFCISSSYIRIVTNRTGTKKAVYKEKKLKVTSPVLALAKKDIRHFFSSPLYVLNGAFGLLMGIALGVFMIVKSDLVDLLATQMAFSKEAVACIAFAILNLATSTVIISACSLSVEGKSFWIIKSMPTDARSVIFSKTVMQFLVSVPPIFVSSILILAAARPAPYYWIIFIIAPQLANLFYSFTGILINVALPKFTYENEAQAVKQSLSTLLQMLISMLVSAAALVAIFFASLKGDLLAILLLIGVPVLLLSIEAVFLLKPAEKCYNKLIL